MNSKEIQRICSEREISTLIHFTKASNLTSILREGLVGRNVLDGRQDLHAEYNDMSRLDRCQDAVCLSISFPNYQMFYRYSSRNQSEWAVLQLHPSLLWELDCAFCRENAASNSVTRIPIPLRKSSECFQGMFSDYGEVSRSNLNIPDNYPTHPQAEVLVFKRIDPRYILSADFKNKDTAEAWYAANQNLVNDREIYYSDRYFRPRSDYQHWKRASQDIIIESNLF